MKVLVIDVETSTFQTGNPHSKRNTLEYVGLFDGKEYFLYPIHHGNEPFNKHLEEILKKILEADLIIGHNLKFDLLWLLRYLKKDGIQQIFTSKRYYDTSLCEYLLKNQRRYPSLEGTASEYLLGQKDNGVQAYWDNNVDTRDIPKEVLEKYLTQDLYLTYNVWVAQQPLIKNKQALIDLHNEDLVTLLQMEYNGLPWFDEQEALKQANEIETALKTNASSLQAIVGGPLTINWDSPSQVSTVLFGGEISNKERVLVTKEYKNKGSVIKEQWGEVTYTYKAIATPPKNLRVGDSGKYSVKDSVLKKTVFKHRAVKKLLLKRRTLSKKSSTYLKGLPALREEMDWEVGRLYPQYSQVVAVTGRLASSKPNGQNIPGDVKTLFKG